MPDTPIPQKQPPTPDPAPDKAVPGNGPGRPGSSTRGQPSGIDLESESAAGEEDPGAGLDAPPAKD